MTEQMCIFFAACFILRGHDMHIDFLQFVSGQRDLPSDTRTFIAAKKAPQSSARRRHVKDQKTRLQAII